jgi:hypothetical protein
MDVKIRTETAADVPAIGAVTISAFLNAPHTSHTEQLGRTALSRTTRHSMRGNEPANQSHSRVGEFIRVAGAVHAPATIPD